ncbi:MAG: hypothetical protein Ct9H90mP22_0720 [Gammaproteobacteria bacterium]|nr:MAG: hypothetical protein Ct9H90mP22_0720 [Gammaproteobacteria bacterium]
MFQKEQEKNTQSIDTVILKTRNLDDESTTSNQQKK